MVMKTDEIGSTLTVGALLKSRYTKLAKEQGELPASATTREQPVEWLGSIECDYCHKKGEELAYLYDAKTTDGPWATMCSWCFKEHNASGLGTGRGQCYKRQDDGRYLKIQG